MFSPQHPRSASREAARRRPGVRTATPRAGGLGPHFTGDLTIRDDVSRGDASRRAAEVDRLRLPTLLGRGWSFSPPDPGPRGLSLVRTQSFKGALVMREDAVWR